MLSPLTKEQRIKVEENMGLVGKVIKDCVHTLGAGSMFGYDDLFQIGCLGLCKAAQTDKPGHTVAFSTYASRCSGVLSSNTVQGSSAGSVATSRPRRVARSNSV